MAQILGTSPTFVEATNFPPRPFLEVSHSLGADLWIYDVSAAWWILVVHRRHFCFHTVPSKWAKRGNLKSPKADLKPLACKENISYSCWTLDSLKKLHWWFHWSDNCNRDNWWKFSQSMNVLLFAFPPNSQFPSGFRKSPFPNVSGISPMLGPWLNTCWRWSASAHGLVMGTYRNQACKQRMHDEQKNLNTQMYDTICPSLEIATSAGYQDFNRPPIKMREHDCQLHAPNRSSTAWESMPKYRKDLRRDHRKP